MSLKMTSPYRLTRRLGALLVAIVALAVYANTLGHDFTWDDGYNVVDNASIRDPGNIPSFWFESWGSEADDAMSRGINTNYWRPVTQALFTLEHAAFGLNPTAFHASNVLWHVVASVLVWLLATRLIPDPGAARFGLLFGALAFAVHPVHTEVVNVVSYRSDLLAAVATLGVLLAWLGLRAERSSGAATRGVFLWSPLLYALGLGSKEMAVTAVLLVALLDVLCPPRPLTVGDRVRRLLPMASVCILYLCVRAALLEPSTYSYFGDEGASVVAQTMLGVFGLYARLLLVPWPLNPFYDWSAVPFETQFFALRPLVGLGLLLVWLGVIASTWRKRPTVAFLLGLYLVVLIPVSQVVPVVVAAGERFLYLAIAGPLLAVGWVAAWPRLSRFRRVLVPAGLAILLAWGGLTVLRNQDWQSDRRILEANVADWPQSFNAWMGLAKLHEREARWEDARVIYEKIGRDVDAERMRLKRPPNP